MTDERTDVGESGELEELRGLVEQVPAFLWVVGPDLRVRRMHGPAPLLERIGSDRLVGLTIDEGMTLGGVPPDVQAVWRDMHLRALRGGVGEYLAHYQGLAVEARVQPLRDARGAIVGILGVGVDVTEQQITQQRLRESEERFRALVEHGADLIGVLDERARLVYASPSYTRVLGYSPEELHAMPDVWPLVHPEDVAYAQQQFGELARRGGFMVPRPVRCVARDGRVRSFAVTLTDLRSEPAVRGVVVNARDVTDEQLLAAQLQQSQKLEALGLLAGSVAHDFNNLLSAILGGLELARGAVADGTELADDLDEVREAGLRAATLTRQLLAFSRAQVRRPQALDLREAVRRAEKLLRRLLPEAVTLDVVLSAEPCVVRADVVQLEQVMMNLVVNAADAVAATGAPGVVTLEVARRDSVSRGSNVAEPRAAARAGVSLQAGPHAALLVRDTGVGMDAATLRRAFEPLFTTKAEGKGTGLGLATAASIVAQSGGAIEAESTPGAGTTFVVLLPLLDAPPDADCPTAEVPPLARGSETILLVEDEGVVRDAAERILARHGYRVLTARDGVDAMHVWRERAGAVDAVVTDVHMPTMGGRELTEQLRMLQPTLPLVLMSGYAGSSEPADAALLTREIFLEKPFTAESLLLHVRAALDRGAEPDAPHYHGA